MSHVYANLQLGISAMLSANLYCVAVLLTILSTCVDVCERKRVGKTEAMCVFVGKHILSVCLYVCVRAALIQQSAGSIQAGQSVSIAALPLLINQPGRQTVVALPLCLPNRELASL